MDAVWIDTERCTGCGQCVSVCPAGAIELVEGVARVDEDSCTGCEACIEACPVEAIHPILEGEIVPRGEPARPVTQRPSPLARTVGTAAAVAGVRAGIEVVSRLGQALMRWIDRRTMDQRRRDDQASGPREVGSRGGRGRRHRRRGGR